MSYFSLPLVILPLLLHFLVVNIPINFFFKSTQKYTPCKSGGERYGHKKYDVYTPLHNHTSATLHRDTTYNYINTKQIIPRVWLEWKTHREN